jgi:hypothetical protein
MLSLLSISLPYIFPLSNLVAVVEFDARALSPAKGAPAFCAVVLLLETTSTFGRARCCLRLSIVTACVRCALLCWLFARSPPKNDHLFQICQPLNALKYGDRCFQCLRTWMDCWCVPRLSKRPPAGCPLTRSLPDIQTKITMEIAF